MVSTPDSEAGDRGSNPGSPRLEKHPPSLAHRGGRRPCTSVGAKPASRPPELVQECFTRQKREPKHDLMLRFFRTCRFWTTRSRYLRVGSAANAVPQKQEKHMTAQHTGVSLLVPAGAKNGMSVSRHTRPPPGGVPSTALSPSHQRTLRCALISLSC